MKEKILQLRSEGKSYKEIQKALGCSLGTISHHCGKNQKEKSRERGKRWKKRNVLKVKLDNTKTRLREKIKDYKRRNGSRHGCVDSDIASYKEVVDMIGDNPTCYLTGDAIDLTDAESYQLDHYIPSSRGGDNTIANLRIATKEANFAKGNLLHDEFIDLCKKVLTHNGYIIL